MDSSEMHLIHILKIVGLILKKDIHSVDQILDGKSELPSADFTIYCERKRNNLM